MLKIFTDNIETVLRSGGIGIIPTDTLYSIVGSALKSNAVLRIYKLRRRNPKKPMIILVGSFSQLKIFGIKTDIKTKRILNKLWPGKVSVILRVKSPASAPPSSELRRTSKATAGKQESGVKFKYLHRGTGTLAFRLPKPLWLRRLLEKSGPLVAPSANFEGEPPAETIKEAKKYFGDKVDFYIDAGRLYSRPSTLVKIEKRKIIVLRKGAQKI